MGSRNAGVLCAILSLTNTLVQAALTQPSQGQPAKGLAGQFEIVGETLVSAQQMFLGTTNSLFILDKAENNPTQIRGHPAWASRYTIDSNKAETMDVLTNTFCAGGNVLGDGTWLNIGGNQAVAYGGDAALVQDGSSGPYADADGRNSVRLLKACDDDSCPWSEGPDMTTRRWYPSVETLSDGTAIILGGCQYGGYVNDPLQANPTYEFYPSTGAPINSNFLQNTLPTNLYPLTWLLPSDKLFMQAQLQTILLDYRTNAETKLDDMPDGIVRTYPASAGTAMLPLTPANNYTATILFCGGNNIPTDKWNSTITNIIAVPASSSCVQITPEVSPSYVQDDPMPVGLSMSNLIMLPNGKILMVGGAKMGTAGYGNETWVVGMSYADGPNFQPAIYDPEAPAGSRWSSEGLSPSTIARMYHSTAMLLPNGAVFVAGSNPNSDYNVGPNVPYSTEYRAEKFYPSYFNERRPEPAGLPTALTYGGSSFDITLNSDDLSGDIKNIESAKVVVIRTGFATHAMNMGQRFLQLDSTWTGFAGNVSGILHVKQLPPNAAVFAPGPALLFVVVNGIPSIGVSVNIGSGKLGAQPVLAAADLPESGMGDDDVNLSNNGTSSGKGKGNSASSVQFSLTSCLALLYVTAVSSWLFW